MISLRKLFGRDDKFFDLLEESAVEARASAALLKRLFTQLHTSPDNQDFSEFTESRHKDKRIYRQITEALAGHSSPRWNARTSRRWRSRSTRSPSA